MRSHPAKHGEGFDAPPTLERSGSEHRRAVTSLALLERARAWEWVKDPPFAREGQEGRKNHVIIQENNLLFPLRIPRNPKYPRNAPTLLCMTSSVSQSPLQKAN